MELPKVYANPIDNEIINNQKIFYEEEEHVDLLDLRKQFDENGYVNRLPVILSTKDGEKECKLVLCKKDYFVTLDNERIYFKDILSYNIKK